jgi:hypothetical protein
MLRAKRGRQGTKFGRSGYGSKAGCGRTIGSRRVSVPEARRFSLEHFQKGTVLIE